ncbi:MAG TPA: TonB-dependent receptor, partial [Bryobacteraceae bacterium]|nr:TonB-dependent receptor [Bryobacteraceae bacterium]
MNKRRFKFLIFIAPLILIFGLSAQTTGSLSGKVNNSAGAPVANATVTVTPVNGGTPQKVLTGPDGAFVIAGLPPGAYRVEVEYSGYKRSSVQNLDLVTGGPATIQVELEHGNVQETVQVQATAVLVEPENAQAAITFPARNVTETPIFDRNHQELTQFTPGVTPPRPLESRLLDPQRDRIWETNGLADGTNYKTLDGVPNIEPFTGRSVYVTPSQGVQQLNLITSNYDAQYGRAAGSILNPATRRGSNDVHGSLFEFNSNSFFHARNFFNPKGFAQSHSNINQFGVSVGGPLHRDTTFFFINYEGSLDRSQVPTVTTVPTADFRAGNFSAVPGLTLYNPATGTASGAGRSPFANNVIPPARIAPVAQSLMAGMPLPNLEGFENNYFANVPYRNDGHRGDVRLDHRIGEKANLFTRWSYANYITDESSPLGLLGGGNGRLLNHNAMLGGSYSFSPSGVVDLRLNYTRYSDRLRNMASPFTPAGLGFSDPTTGIANAVIPQFSITGMQAFGSTANFPQHNINNNFNVTNGWNVVTGRHTLRLGFDVWHIRASGFQNYTYGPGAGYVFGPGATASPTGQGLGPFGTFANSFASFLLGTPTQAGRDAGYWNPGYTQWQAAAYVSDSLKLGRRLTLDIGGRWDVFTPLAPMNSSGVFIYDPAANQLLPTNVNGVDNVGNIQTNWKNVAPRIGLAYRPLGSVVVRAGYGINFFNGPLNFWAGSLMTNIGTSSGGSMGSFAAAPGASLSRLPAAPPASFATATAAVSANNIPVYFTPSNVRTPYVQNFDFQIQSDLGRYGLVGSIGYAGNLGRELPYSRDLNAAAPGTGSVGQPFFSRFGRTASVIERATGLTSNYNSLQASLSKRFGQGLSFTAAYTYSRSLDHGTGGTAPLLNNSSFQANYGPSDWDRAHMFTLSHVWQLPIGANTGVLSEGVIGKILGPWQIDGVFRWVSGTPLTITADPTLCNCPGNTPTASTVVSGF